ncbi:catalase [Helicobacter ailurogastricus]|uniref:catalase n=1 Tax=Helicobacter ailurogastricus TaxID=1578720 RepID=UPI0022BCC44D|nr:catalase [Helicobacter ailurogastricus]GLH58338.1 Catalase-like protein [Helicobacter ailurogastricus]GLH59846.1 Catalase-like protein [Helicobacter ailurogastricus]
MPKFACSLLLPLVLLSLTHAKEVYDAQKIADLFYQLNGDAKDPHKKINHAKGFCAAGVFVPDAKVTAQLDIPLLDKQSIPAEVRYSLGGGNLHASDKSKSRGMALRFGRDAWVMVMTNAPINFAKNAEEFGRFLEIRIPKNGHVDREKIKRVTQEVQSFRNFAHYMQSVGVTKSVANTRYYSTHTFYFKDKKTQRFLPARFSFIPVEGVHNLTNAQLKRMGDDFLEKDFQEKVAKAPIVYDMVLELAHKNDPINDTTKLWHGKHEEIKVGQLKVESYSGHGCDGEVFMPAMLPSGVEAPKDPLFKLRNEVYSITFAKRQ